MSCWLGINHPGPVSICDRLLAKPGLDWSARKAVTDRIGDTVNIPLWDYVCDPPGPTLGTCPGDLYPVAGFGCIKILAWQKDVDFPVKPPTDPPTYCAKNTKIILAEKLCDCESSSGGTDGLPADVDDVEAVSLIL